MNRTSAPLLAVLALALAAGATSAAEPVKVRVAYLQADLHHLPLWVALDQGYFKAEGLDVELAGAFRTGAELVSSFKAGDLDVAYVGQSPATLAVARRTADIQVLALVNAEGSEVVVRAADPARTLADLRGRTIAIPGIGSMQDLLLGKALAAAGLQGAVKVIVLRVPEMEAALAAGQIDAFIAWQPFGAQARAHGVARTLLPSKAIWPGHPCCVLVGTRPFLAARGPAAAGLVRAHARAIRFIREHRPEAVAVAAKRTGLDPKVIELALADVAYEHRLDRAHELEIIRSLVDLGYLDKADPEELLGRLLAPGAEVAR